MTTSSTVFVDDVRNWVYRVDPSSYQTPYTISASHICTENCADATATHWENLEYLNRKVDAMEQIVMGLQSEVEKLKEIISDNMGFECVDSLTEFLEEFRRDDE